MRVSFHTNILLRYTVGTFVVVLIISTIFGYVLSRWASEQLISTHTAIFPEIVRHVAGNQPQIYEFFKSGGSPENSEQVKRLIEDLQRIGSIFRIKAWGKGGVILFSNDPSIIGKKYPNNTNFQDAWEGRVSHSLSDPNKPEHISELGHGEVLEIYAPLYQDGAVVGVVEIYEEADVLFKIIRERIAVVWLLAALSGLIFYCAFFIIFYKAHQRQKLDNLQLIKTQDVIIYALAFQSGLRDLETGQHLDRICLYVEILTEVLRKSSPYKKYLSRDYIKDIVKAASLHDIGKVGIPDSILTKKGKLTPEERHKMQKHCEIGAMVLKDAEGKLTYQSFLTLSVQMTLHHHEKWDGSGYPDKLKAEGIPLSARIIALADVYDALRSERHYKPAFDHEKAKEIILSEKGTHFDPHIVDAFVACEEKFRLVSIELVDQVLNGNGSSRPALKS